MEKTINLSAEDKARFSRLTEEAVSRLHEAGLIMARATGRRNAEVVLASRHIKKAADVPARIDFSGCVFVVGEDWDWAAMSCDGGGSWTFY